TATLTDLQEGTYVIACFLTDADGHDHASMGMLGTVTVTGADADELPEADGTITLDDDRIELPDGFDGHGTYAVANSGTKTHGFQLAHLDGATTLEEYNTHIGRSMQSSTAVDGGGGTLAGGIDSLAPGSTAYLTVDLPSGRYGYVSAPDQTGAGLPPLHGELTVS
ncbi:MAG TPA: hypothetical protein VNQ33_07350, partial [Acidimicrobiales bacterium]|nr:hypothetical protein [Acidimicrobiales bacterium]